MNAILAKPLEFAPGEHFRTRGTQDFPEFIATSAFFIVLADIHLTQLVAIERPTRLFHQGVMLPVREFTIALPESLATGNYKVGGDSDVSLSINVDNDIYPAVSGTITLNPQLEGKQGGSFHVTIEHPHVPEKTFALNGEFNVKLKFF